MKCTIPDCPREARSKKSGICNTHYERQRLGREPRLPVAPLIDFATRVGKREALGDMPDHDLGLGRADEACCNVLGVHPTAVYGETYWAAA